MPIACVPPNPMRTAQILGERQASRSKGILGGGLEAGASDRPRGKRLPETEGTKRDTEELGKLQRRAWESTGKLRKAQESRGTQRNAEENRNAGKSKELGGAEESREK